MSKIKFFIFGVVILFSINGNILSTYRYNNVRRTKSITAVSEEGIHSIIEIILQAVDFESEGDILISQKGIFLNGNCISPSPNLGSIGEQSFQLPQPFKELAIRIIGVYSGLSQGELQEVMRSWNKHYALAALGTEEAVRTIFRSVPYLTSSAVSTIEHIIKNDFGFRDAAASLLKRPDLNEEGVIALRKAVECEDLELETRVCAIACLTKLLNLGARISALDNLRSETIQWLNDCKEKYASSELVNSFKVALSGIYAVSLEEGLDLDCFGPGIVEFSSERELNLYDKGPVYAERIIQALVTQKKYDLMLEVLKNNSSYIENRITVLDPIASGITEMPDSVCNRIIDFIIANVSDVTDKNALVTLLHIAAPDVEKAQKLIQYLITRYENLAEVPVFSFNSPELLQALKELLYSPTISAVWEDVTHLIKVIPHPFTPYITREPFFGSGEATSSNSDTLVMVSRNLDDTYKTPLMSYQRIMLHGHKNYVSPSNMNVAIVEGVLNFWLTGDIECIRNLPHIESEGTIKNIMDDNLDTYVSTHQEVLQGLFHTLQIDNVQDLQKFSIEEIAAACTEGKVLEEIKLYFKVLNKYQGGVAANVRKDLQSIEMQGLVWDDYPPQIHQLFNDFIASWESAEDSESLIAAADRLQRLMLSVQEFCVSEIEPAKNPFVKIVVHKDLERLEFKDPKFTMLNVLYYKLILAQESIYSKVWNSLASLESLNREGLSSALGFLKSLTDSLEEQGYINDSVIQGVVEAITEDMPYSMLIDHIMWCKQNIYNPLYSMFLKNVLQIDGLSDDYLRDREIAVPCLEYFRKVLGYLHDGLSNSQILKAELLGNLAPEFVLIQQSKSLSPLDIGNKAWSLNYLNQNGFQAPEAAVITKEVIMNWENMSEVERHDIIGKIVLELEQRTGKEFGRNLLFSVRSSPVIPHPGVLLTMLDVGMNESVVENLIAEIQDERFAWENYRVAEYMWAVEYLGIKDENLRQVINRVKEAHGVETKKQLNVDAIKEVIYEYGQLIDQVREDSLSSGSLEIGEDPMSMSSYEQLYLAVVLAVKSYNSEAAQSYRRSVGIPEDSGMGIIIQAMSFGNYSQSLSGAGTVNVTADGEIRGTFNECSLGVDIMSGLSRAGIPVSNMGTGDASTSTLEFLYPDVYKELYTALFGDPDTAKVGIFDLFGRQPIQYEFVIEQNKIVSLQVRTLAEEEIYDRKQLNYVEIPSSVPALGRGIFIGNRAVKGYVITIDDYLDQGKRAELIAKVDSDPDIDGLILATSEIKTAVLGPILQDAYILGFFSNVGYEVSHGISLAIRYHISALLGVRNLSHDFTTDEYTFKVGSQQIVLKSGDIVTIDTDGKLYQGAYPIYPIEQ
ncbi:MAG: PEP/pyruvate-binding domain-containing protein [Candidatus Kaelpia imicola]|nr:PEP/pyruvate-binding domain-containing protein [Candidatus Kaelpia imicola]